MLLAHALPAASLVRVGRPAAARRRLIAVSVMVRLIRVCWPQRCRRGHRRRTRPSRAGALLRRRRRRGVGASPHSLQPKQEDALDSAVPAEAALRVMGGTGGRRGFVVAGAVAGGGSLFRAAWSRRDGDSGGDMRTRSERVIACSPLAACALAAATSPAAAAAAVGRAIATAACAALLPNATWRLELFVIAALARRPTMRRALTRAAAVDAGSDATEAFASTCVAAASAAAAVRAIIPYRRPSSCGSSVVRPLRTRARRRCVRTLGQAPARAVAAHVSPRCARARALASISSCPLQLRDRQTDTDKSATHQVDGTSDQWTIARSAECCFFQTSQASARASPWAALA